MSGARAALLLAAMLAAGSAGAQERSPADQDPAIDLPQPGDAPVAEGERVDPLPPAAAAETEPPTRDDADATGADAPIRTGSGETAPLAPALIVDDPVAQAQQVLGEFHAALAQGSRDAVLALLAADAVLYDDGQVAHGRDDYAARLLDLELQAAPGIQREALRVEVLGSGDTLWVLQESRLRRTLADIDMSFEETETLVLRRQFDGWKIVHRHRSARPLLH